MTQLGFYITDKAFSFNAFMQTRKCQSIVFVIVGFKWIDERFWCQSKVVCIGYLLHHWDQYLLLQVISGVLPFVNVFFSELMNTQCANLCTYNYYCTMTICIMILIDVYSFFRDITASLQTNATEGSFLQTIRHKYSEKDIAMRSRSRTTSHVNK